MSGEPFLTGVYRHYRGGLFTAIGLATHHETRAPMVIYVEHATGEVNVRPLRPVRFTREGNHQLLVDPDAWIDFVEHEGSRVARFAYVGPAGKIEVGKVQASGLSAQGDIPPDGGR